LMALKQGYLTKEGGNVRSWKKRWFILGNQTLSYYKNENQLNKILGVIQLKEVSYVENKMSIKRKKKGEMTLHVVTPNRNYYMIAETHEVLDSWQNVISNQVDVALGRRDSDIPIDGKKIGVDDFTMISIIGQGSFGKVVQVRMKDTGDIFAMKVLSKKNVVERGELEHTISERNILMNINHPFIMKLHYSFQSPDKLYLVMDFVNGGELFYHLQQTRRFPVERALFYTAEITLGLEYLHLHGIIYRDLKPENLLLDADGHVKITDFGLSKEGLFDEYATTHTFCGTPEYLAPEVIEGKNYTKSVDWWSLGTLLFEMLSGMPPFYDEDIQKMYQNKMNNDIQFPQFVQDPATRDLISKLLDKDSISRLQEASLVKAHPYFSSINWDALIRKRSGTSL